jgi:hypothetical protein
MNARTNVYRSLLAAAPVILALAAAPRTAHAQAAPAQQGMQERPKNQDPGLLKAGRGTGAPGDTTAPAAAPPATGAEVGKAVDAMSATCGKAQTLSAQIEAAVARRKAADAARTKSNAELKKKLNAVLAAQKKVERASKKPGSDAAGMADAARVEYEAALAQSKTVEVETQNLQMAQNELASLVTAAQEAASSCASNEAAIRKAAADARKAVDAAKRDAAKARALAGVPEPKALEAARARLAKELEATRTSTESARAALEAMKAEAVKQPPPSAAPAGKPEGKPEGKKPAADKPK